MSYQILALIEHELGSKGFPTNKGNYAFYSPFISHRKRKLEVELDINNQYFGQWHCWVSDQKGRDIDSLFKRINASKKSREELKELLKDTKYRRSTIDYTEDEKKFISLPREFRKLSRPSRSPEYKNALYYVKSRGLTEYDILKYNIGYCEEGRYNGYIIIPSYDERGVLNYFVTRTYYDSDYKHKNPPMERNIIGFDILINWREPITLVEGSFDAISAKINAIPLFGKSVLENLKLKIVENKVKDIYIGLDSDALKNALKISEYFMGSGINVYLLELGEDDPSKMGYNKFQEIKRKTKKLTFSNIVKYKLQYGI